MASTSYDSRINLALLALKNDQKLSVRKAAKLYSVDHSTLTRRTKGQSSRRDIRANSMRFSKLEEEAIVRRVLELDSQGFPVRLSSVEDMANRLLSERDASHVGVNWASNFVRRQPELKTRLSRPYDYQRALCEDPEKIQGWFERVQRVKHENNVHDDDIWNFDETGFLMGVIGPVLVVTSSDRRANTKLIQPGNREWVSVIQGVNSEGCTIPPFIVFKGNWHMSNWYGEEGLPYGWQSRTTKNGWTTNETALEWIKHFDKSSRTNQKGVYRLLILDGHESHHSDAFEEYCRTNNILTLCMPPHSSHLLQPLDISCFGPLKKAYSRQIEDLVRGGQTHIGKESFLPAFKEAFHIALTSKNIQAGFQGAGLVPYDPERVISKLDVRIFTPTPQNSRPPSSQAWVSQTPNNPFEANSQTNLIKNKVVRHQNSSPTQILDALDQFAKGTSQVMYELALLRAENRNLRRVNNELSRRRRTKKRRLQQGGTLSQEDIDALTAQDDVTRQIQGEEGKNQEGGQSTQSYERRCSNCNQPGHNVRTCQVDRATSEEFLDI